jgi:dipeptidyl aminopeptidase/acylaminoacyl peptidase
MARTKHHEEGIARLPETLRHAFAGLALKINKLVKIFASAVNPRMLTFVIVEISYYGSGGPPRRLERSSMMKIHRWVCLAFALFLSACSFISNEPSLIPREILFGNPERSNPQISPDGKYLTYLAPDKDNVMQLWVRTRYGKDDRRLTDEKKRGVFHYTWLYDGEHLVFAQDNDGDENWQIHLVDIASGAERNLTPYKGVQSLLVALEPKFPREMLVAMNLRNRSFHDVYRINITTGETLMVNRNGGRQVWWAADGNFKIRIGATLAGVIIRDAEKSPWRTLRRAQPGETGGFYGFSRDEKTFYKRGTPDENTSALLAIDLAAGKETVLAHDLAYDVEHVLVHPATKEVQAVAFYRDKLEWQAVDPGIADDLARLKQLQRGEFTLVHPPYFSPITTSESLGRRDLQDKIWIVSYESDDGAIRHYAYDRASKTSTLLFGERPKLESLRLASMQPISYESRDGLTLHGYLTLPVGVPAKNLPAVLLVHGGPWLRDRWGYYDTVQWLANRGYAVLQVNYRGSAGYGRKFIAASFKEWGGKMHDDLVDGVSWLVRNGVADSKRFAIMGASYGGYATFVGLTFTPDLFAAGVSRVGISNLVSQHDTAPAYWKPWGPMWARRVGDPKTEQELLKSRSPLFFVDRIKAPLLIAHGRNDVRVVAAESEQMVEAMRKANKAVEYVIYEDEGHRLLRAENKFHFYAKAEEFLAKHLGGRFEPEGALAGHAGVTK